MRLAVVTLLCLVACKRDRVTGTEGELRLSTTRLVFPHAYLDQTRRAQLGITNTAVSDATVRAGTDAPFGAPVDTDLPGATTTSLTLTFTPTELGDFERDLTLVSDDTTLHVTLVGTADPDPECISPSPCRTSAFDRPSGTCIETPVSDGLDCAMSNPCLKTAQCIAGNCVGTAIDCEDHDACTTDVCEPARGCVHFAATAQCGASPDPCHAPACDPVVGCTLVDAPDGTRCGHADCSVANICLSGMCKAVTVNEGAACGDPSPCQPRGRCTTGACVRPAPTGLTAAWTVWVEPNQHVEWGGLADSVGNVYWRQSGPDGGATKLVSVTPRGVARWEVPIPAKTVQVAVVDGVLVLRLRSGLEGRRISDGVRIWARDLPLTDVSVATISRGIGGSLYVGETRLDGGKLLGASVWSLNVFDGAPLWQIFRPGEEVEDQTSPVDETGHVYVSTWGVDSKRRYVSYSPSGSLRWAIENSHSGPAAVFGGRVYHWDHWISDTLDGGFVNHGAPQHFTSGFPRLALGSISYVGTEYLDAGSCRIPATDEQVPELHLVRVDPSTSAVRWDLTISSPHDGGGGAITNPILTSNSSIVFSQARDYCNTGPQLLRGVSAFGEPEFICELPFQQLYFGEGLLLDGLWIAAVREPDGGVNGVRAISLDGFTLPEHGWATAWGSSARDNHAR